MSPWRRCNAGDGDPGLWVITCGGECGSVDLGGDGVRPGAGDALNCRPAAVLSIHENLSPSMFFGPNGLDTEGMRGGAERRIRPVPFRVPLG